MQFLHPVAISAGAFDVTVQLYNRQGAKHKKTYSEKQTYRKAEILACCTKLVQRLGRKASFPQKSKRLEFYRTESSLFLQKQASKK